MKIAHVISHFQPQFGFQESALAKKQSKMGHEVCVITSDRYSRPARLALKSSKVGSGIFKEDGIMVYRLPTILETSSDILVYGFKKALREFQPDIVHAHGILNVLSFLSAMYKRVMGYNLVVDIHVIVQTSKLSTIKSCGFELLRRTTIPYVLRKADGLIAITPLCQRWLHMTFGVPYSKIQVLPLGVDTNMFRRDERERRRIRNIFNIKGEDVLVIYVGDISPNKYIDMLVNAVIQLVQKRYPIKLLMIGSGDPQYLQKIVNVCDEHIAKRNIILNKFVNHKKLSSFFSAADIGVWLGNRRWAGVEGYPTAIMEAMAAGLPIVIVNSRHIKYLLKYKSGLSFDREDLRGLIRCLESLVRSKNLRQEMGLLSRKLAMNEFEWEDINQKAMRVYKEARTRESTNLQRL